jgi:hypothetical protein
MKLKLLQTELRDYVGKERHGNHLKAIFREAQHTPHGTKISFFCEKDVKSSKRYNIISLRCKPHG